MYILAPLPFQIPSLPSPLNSSIVSTLIVSSNLQSWSASSYTYCCFSPLFFSSFTTTTYNFLQAISTDNPLYIFWCTKSSLKYKGKHSEIFNATIQTPESILSCEKENLYAPMLSTADAIPLFQQLDVHKSLSPLSVVWEHRHVIWVTCISEKKANWKVMQNLWKTSRNSKKFFQFCCHDHEINCSLISSWNQSTTLGLIMKWAFLAL